MNLGDKRVFDPETIVDLLYMAEKLGRRTDEYQDTYANLERRLRSEGFNRPQVVAIMRNALNLPEIGYYSKETIEGFEHEVTRLENYAACAEINATLSREAVAVAKEELARRRIRIVETTNQPGE